MLLLAALFMLYAVEPQYFCVLWISGLLYLIVEALGRALRV